MDPVAAGSSVAAPASAAPAPALPAAGDYGSMLLTSLLVLAVVCVLAVVLVRVSRRWGLAGRPADRALLDVVARVPLEPRRSLYVVDVAGKALLVGTSEMGLTVLSELDRDVVRAQAQARPTRGFTALVREAVARRSGDGRIAPPPASEREGGAS